MAILIPNMEMPDTCADCLLEYDSMLCRALSEGFYDKEHFDFTVERLPNCPLISVPEPYITDGKVTLLGSEELFRLLGITKEGD